MEQDRLTLIKNIRNVKRLKRNYLKTTLFALGLCAVYFINSRVYGNNAEKCQQSYDEIISEIRSTNAYAEFLARQECYVIDEYHQGKISEEAYMSKLNYAKTDYNLVNKLEFVVDEETCENVENISSTIDTYQDLSKSALRAGVCYTAVGGVSALCWLKQKREEEYLEDMLKVMDHGELTYSEGECK